MKYYEIYDEYINSREFEDDIIKLKEKEGEPEVYIKKYIKLALKLNDFFTADGRKIQCLLIYENYLIKLLNL